MERINRYAHPELLEPEHELVSADTHHYANIVREENMKKAYSAILKRCGSKISSANRFKKSHVYFEVPIRFSNFEDYDVYKCSVYLT